MAKSKDSSFGGRKAKKAKIKRPGRHSKRASVYRKDSKTYRKTYRGQGR